VEPSLLGHLRGLVAVPKALTVGGCDVRCLQCWEGSSCAIVVGNISYRLHSVPAGRQYKARELTLCRGFPQDSDCGNAHTGVSHIVGIESASNFQTYSVLKYFSNATEFCLEGTR
jgi:hypothetical protein